MIIYTLKLAEGKYYVGKTRDLMIRLEQHKNGNVSTWTTKYPIISLLENFVGDKYDEDKTVLKYMEIYGVSNVRGGIYSNENLSFDQQLAILKSIRAANDTCLRCGSVGHFISNCDRKVCYRCGDVGHLVEDCKASNHIHGGIIYGCYRCGRSGHWAFRCNRSRDIYGKKIVKSCVIS